MKLTLPAAIARNGLCAAIAAFLQTIALQAHAQTDPGTAASGIVTSIQRDSTYARVASFEYNGPVAYVRIEAREPGSAPNEFPMAIEPAALRALLAAVQLPSSKDKSLFNAAELDEIVDPLARALGNATTEQDVCLAVSGRHGSFGPLSPRSVTTARVLRTDGHLNLVFGLVRHDWESNYRANGSVIAFEPGHRAAPIKYEPAVAIGPEFGTSLRSDWLVLTPQAALAAPAPASAPAVAAPASVPPAAGDRSYDALADHLRTLKKLRDDGLITEQEYDQKRRQILDKL